MKLVCVFRLAAARILSRKTTSDGRSVVWLYSTCGFDSNGHAWRLVNRQIASDNSRTLRIEDVFWEPDDKHPPVHLDAGHYDLPDDG